MTGITSLFLYTENLEILDKLAEAIKYYCPVNHFNKKELVWEIPVLYLAELLDRITYLDDITFESKEENEEKVHYYPKLEYKTKPFKHQLEGIEYGINHDKWLLLDGMGLGKSFQIINIARELKEQKNIKHCLVICGINTLKTNWKNEISIHSNETCRVLGEKVSRNGKVTYAKVSERARELKENIDEFFIVTNIETFRNDEVVKAFLKSKNSIDMIVLDEAHKCKNKLSAQGKNLLKLNAKYKIAATGTLLLNNPLDAYVPLKWTDNEKSCLSAFKEIYCVYGGFGGKEITGYKNIDFLKNEIDNCSLRRTKDLLDLPEKTVINEYVDLSEEHMDIYQAVVDGVKEDFDLIDLKPNNVLSITTRLRQATIYPNMLTSKPIISNKIERCVDIVEQIVSQGDKIVIMSSFKEPVSALVEKLSGYKLLVCTGDTAPYEIDMNVKKFQQDPEYKIMICTWQKMGTGHTLTAASYMVFLDTPYTFGLFDQACDRIHRIGTKNPVFIYNLIATGTIDEKVAFILEKKKAISDFIIDGMIDDYSMKILQKYIEDL